MIFKGLAKWMKLVAIAAVAAVAAPAAPPLPYGGLPTAYSYPELADMTLAAPLALTATILRATPLRGDAATGVPAGEMRYYIEAVVTALIGGRAELPSTVTYLVDLPPEAPRKLKLKGVPVLLLAATAARPGELRLIGPRAQAPRTPENEARVRAILAEAVRGDAPPAIIGVARAFHVAGSLPGEGESQIFLRTADARPISLTVLRRPGEAPRWAVALSELVDDSAAPPRRDTLLWYRLACGLPATLPDAAVSESEAADAEQARADYALVVKDLGPCGR